MTIAYEKRITVLDQGAVSIVQTATSVLLGMSDEKICLVFNVSINCEELHWIPMCVYGDTKNLLIRMHKEYHMHMLEFFCGSWHGRRWLKLLKANDRCAFVVMHEIFDTVGSPTRTTHRPFVYVFQNGRIHVWDSYIGATSRYGNEE